MKVLHIAGTIGTIVHFRLPVLERLNELGVTNWVAANSYKAHSISDLEKKGIVFFPLLLRNKGLFNYFLSLLRLINLIRREKFDIIHTNTPLGGAVGRFASMLSFLKIPIFHTTGGIPVTPETNSIFKFLYFKTEKFLAKRTHYIFCPSTIDIGIYKANKLSPKKGFIHCGPAGIDPGDFPIDRKAHFRDKLFKELGFNSDIILVGIVARIVVDKGINEFVEIANRMTEKFGSRIKFVAIGDGPILRELSFNGFDKNVTFLGRRSDVPQIMLSLDIFLFPSYREGFPVAVIEAMAGNTAVVAFNIDGCKEAITHDVDGLLVPFGDIDKLFVATLDLFSDTNRRERLAKSARQKVLLNATKQQHVNKHILKYKEYIDN